MSQAEQLDANMIPGQTYTFQLKLGNLVTSPNTSTLQQDITNNAPDFIGSLNVTEEPGSALHWLTNIYDVEFTYNGDGTDVVSDVASSIIAAISQGSNDDFSLVAAYAENAASVSPQSSLSDIGSQIQSGISSATKTLTDTVNSVTAQTGKSAQELLTPVEIAVGVVVLLVVLLIFTAGKSGGASAGPEGVSLGGSK